MEQKPLQEKTLEKSLEKPVAKEQPKEAEKPKIAYEYNGKVYDDEDVASYFKHEHFLYKVSNKLLGDYDQNGKYILPNDVLKDLVALRKVVTKKEGQITYLKATSGTVTFNFKLETGVFAKGQSFAQLFLIEKAAMIAGQDKVEMVSPVVFYTDDTDVYFETKIKKVFNILNEDDVAGGREKENDALALALLEKLKLMGKMYDRFLLETRLRDKIYLEKLLKILAQDPNGSAILKKYEALIKLNQKLLDPASKNYYRILKQLLDQVLLEEEKSLSQEVALLVTRLRKVYVQANSQTIESVKEPAKKEAKKEQKPTKAASGPGPITFKFDSRPAPKPSASKKYNSMYVTAKTEAPIAKQPTSAPPAPTVNAELMATIYSLSADFSSRSGKYIEESTYKMAESKNYNTPESETVSIVEEVSSRLPKYSQESKERHQEF